MARLWSSGFEINDVSGGKEGWLAGGENSITTSTGTVRTGTYSARATSLASGQTHETQFQFASADGDGPYYARVYLNYATAPSADNAIIAFEDGALFGEIAMIKLASDGTLKLFDEDGQIGSASSALSTGMWYRVEIGIDRTPSAGSHVVSARLDGSEFASSSSRNLSSGVSWLTLGGNLEAEAQTTGDWFFDDVAINDTTGSFQTSWPGAGQIIFLRPNGTGSVNDWTGAYTDINETTPNDDTNYIRATVADDEYSFNIEDTSLGAGVSITLAAVGVRFTYSGASSHPTFKVSCTGNSVTEYGVEIDPVTTTYRTNSPTAPFIYPLTMYDLPGASTSPWTTTHLDSAQIGARIIQGGVLNNARITAEWLLVEHVTVEDADVSESDSITVGEDDTVALAHQVTIDGNTTINRGVRVT